MSLDWEPLKHKAHQIKESLAFFYYMSWFLALLGGGVFVGGFIKWLNTQLHNQGQFSWEWYYLLAPVAIIAALITHRAGRRRRVEAYLNPHLSLRKHELLYLVDQNGTQVRLRSRLSVKLLLRIT